MADDPAMHLLLHTDGGSRGNPGPAGAGIVVTDADTELEVLVAGWFIPKATNNFAEYQALLRGIEACIDMGVTQLEVFADSELMVKQITGEYRVKSADLKPLHAEAQGKLLRVDRWTISHVRRNFNKRADEAANAAMDARRDVVLSDVRGAFGNGSAGAGGRVDKSAGSAKAYSSSAASTTSASSDAPDPTSVTWTAELTTSPSGRCPANCEPGETYPFGPVTPSGLCVHATAAVFKAKPITADRTRLRKATVQCDRCNASIDVHLHR